MKKLDRVIKIAVLTEVVEADFDLALAAKQLGIGNATIYRMFIKWNLRTPVGGNPGNTKLSEFLVRVEAIRVELSNLVAGN